MAIRKKIEVKKKINKPVSIKQRKEAHFKLLNRNCRKSFNKGIKELIVNYNPFFSSRYPVKTKIQALRYMVDYIYKQTKNKKLPETRREFIVLFEDAGTYAKNRLTGF